eukprot:3716376-Heterocapsa_arctica.AAC.1
MDFYVHLTRPGMRIQYRKASGSKVGFSHRLKKEDGMNWFQTKLDQMHGLVSSCEKHAAHHATMAERLKYLEQ